jgi:hypothetical protein
MEVDHVAETGIGTLEVGHELMTQLIPGGVRLLG